ncbi:TPA: prolyl oligopeptidase family serine peptidase [Candidatus Ventrenecus avicola]|nr:prolyl oligopeptidase family serine peptidase [Candidatus Ventrenecus avicola]
MLKKYCKLNDSNYCNINYIVYSPEKKDNNLPLLLFLHGIGERGNKVEDVEKYALPKYMNKFNIPYIIVAPQCTDNNFWDYHLRDVEKILEEVYKEYQYDKNRMCILGSSMGAFGAWNYIMSRPKLFKGIVSVSGGIMLPVNQTLLPLKDKSILIYHGSADDVIDVNESIKIYDKLKSIDSKNIELKIIENDNHFLTSHAFKDKYLYKWLEKNI